MSRSHSLVYCSPLCEASGRDRSGGKAAQLARARRAGAHVPRTVVIERAALRRVLEESSLGARVEEVFAAFAGGSKSAALEDLHRQLAQSLREATLPGDVEGEILEEARTLLATAPAGLAVRSSAEYEDSSSASFAGVFESFLEITDSREVLARVVDCWISSWSPRALRYLARMGLEPRIDAMAVLLQPVVPARAAGVLSTADPKSGNPWELVVRATPGLAADLMSGSGSGDTFRLDWESGAALDTVPLGDRPILGASELRELARESVRLDEVLSSRLDIEWALVEDGLWIVQVRPLTALPDFFPLAPSDLLDPGSAIAGGTDDRDWKTTIWKQPMFVLPLRSDHPQNLLTPLYRDLSESELWHRHQPEDFVLTGIWREERDLNGHRFAADGPQPTFLDHFEDLADCEPWLEKNEPRYRERWDTRHEELDELEGIARDALRGTSTAFELIPVVLDVRDRIWDLNSFGWSGPQALGWMCEGLLRTTLDRLELEVRPTEILGGGADSYTFAVTRSLQQLGRRIDDEEVRRCFAEERLDRIVPRLLETVPHCEFLRLYERHCWKFGRTPPSWHHRPAFWAAIFDQGHDAAMHTVRCVLRGESRDVLSLKREQRAQRDRCTRRLWALIEAREAALLPRMERMLDWARYWTQALNDRHGVGAGLLWERELIWQLGSRLQAEGTIDRPEDVLVLTRDDLETATTSRDRGALRRRYVERRREYRRNRRLVSPKVLGRCEDAPEQPDPSPRPAPGGQDTLTGVGFSRGRASGVARQVRQLDAELLDSLRADDILVLPHEHAFAYADWHSLLTLVRGVVSPGRPAHHISQVARECGVPVVGHVRADLASIPDGAPLEVSADDGTVRLLVFADGDALAE